MATYNRPGVYVNELPLAAAPVTTTAAANAAGAVIAAFAQGPDNVTHVTSWYDFTKKFGGYDVRYPASFSVGSFFQNGGTEIYVKRVLPAAAKKVAKVVVNATDSGLLCTIAAKHRGIDGNLIRIQFSDSRSVRETGYYDLAVYLDEGVADSIDPTSKLVTANGGDNTLVESFNGVNFTDPLSGDYITTILGFGSAYIKVLEGAVTEYDEVGAASVNTYATDNTAGKSPIFGMLALSGANSPETNLTYGDYTGDDVYDPSVVDSTTTATITGLGGSGTLVTYLTTTVFSVGDELVITGLSPSNYNSPSAIVTGLQSSKTKAVTAVAVADAVATYTVGSSHGFLAGDMVTITGTTDGILNLSNAYITTVTSTGIKVAIDAGLNGSTDTVGTVTRGAGFQVASTVTTSVTDGNGSAVRTIDVADSYSLDNLAVFQEFATIEQPLVFFLPDVTTRIATAPDGDLAGWSLSKVVYNALIDWSDASAKNIVVVETASGLTPDQAISSSGDLNLSSRAAVYYPHVFIKDPIGKSGAAVRKIGPSGAVVGNYLATDSKVGPFKAPAGIDASINGALALERAFTPSELDALNIGVATTGVRVGKNVVNAIRNIPGAGVVIMGGRTLKQDGTANKYINMRRSLIYIEKRMNDLLQFAVFENNSEALWGRINTVLGVFLNEYRNQGGLRGATAAEAYYVKCDAENNTNASIAAGQVNVEVGVALEYPAEFVVLNLSQMTAQ